MDILATLAGLAQSSGFAGFLAEGGWKNLIMIGIACVLLYLGIGKKFEPLGRMNTRFISSEAGGGFTGAYVGLFAQKKSQKSRAKGVFDSFSYKAK